ncbi:cytochrome c biogenesis CcdA family protein [Leifsonia sp. SIMBA_070]|uniref:cytochrome c biogenesis CcdA family protein n=1 Tax=Leifsonia sp. SIMBA_070 TaxID=3085810 RepID=UPI00397C5D8C
MTGTALVYAFALGLAATLNPCGFPLLPAYLSVFLGADEDRRHVRILRALRASAAMTAGFVSVFAVVGIATAGGLTLGLAWTPAFTAALGLILLVVGVFGASGRSLRLPAFALPFRSGRDVPAMAGYGAAFAVTSLGCTLPLFLAAASPSVTSGTPLAPVAAALAYALGMGVFVSACSIVAALVGAEAVRLGGRRVARYMPRIAAIVLTCVGIYLLSYGVRVLIAPPAQPSVIALVQAAAGSLGSAVSAHPLALGTIATAVVLTGLAGVAVARRRHRINDTEEQ